VREGKKRKGSGRRRRNRRKWEGRKIKTPLHKILPTPVKISV